MITRLATDIPKRMQKRPLDRRGYPIPYIVVIDQTGQPQFTINDTERVERCLREHRCAICGNRFDRHPVTAKYDLWWVGGSRCFLHPMGGFLDPPLHLECAEYALCVCPFLAATRYSKMIEDAKLANRPLPEGMAIVRHEGVPPSLPERFGLGLSHGYRRVAGGSTFQITDWRYIEWWRAGERINAPATGEPPPMP